MNSLSPPSVFSLEIDSKDSLLTYSCFLSLHRDRYWMINRYQKFRISTSIMWVDLHLHCYEVNKWKLMTSVYHWSVKAMHVRLPARKSIFKWNLNAGIAINFVGYLWGTFLSFKATKSLVYLNFNTIIPDSQITISLFMIKGVTLAG